MENRFDTDIAHAMNQWVLYGILKALSQKDPSFPWDVTEALTNIPPVNDLPNASALGLELAREWVFKAFTRHAPP